MTFMNIHISKKIAKQIIDITSKKVQFVKIENLSNCEIFILGSIDVYNDNLLLENLFKKYLFILTQNSHLTFEMVYFSMLKFLKNKLRPVLTQQLSNNLLDSYPINGNIDDKVMIMVEEDLECVGSTLERIMLSSRWIEKDTHHSLDKQKKYLQNTLEKIKNFGFMDEEFDKILVNLKIHFDKKYKKFITKMRAAKMNYISCSDDNKIYYIHIANILYGYFNLKKLWNNNEKIINKLKYDFNDFLDEEDEILFPNLKNSLISLGSKIHKTQILEFVSKRYFLKFLDALDNQQHFSAKQHFKAYKDIISLIFEKNSNQMWQKDIDIEKIDINLNIFYHPVLDVIVNSFVPIEQYCTEKRQQSSIFPL